METQYDKIPSNVQELPDRQPGQEMRARLNETINQAGIRVREYAQYADKTVHANPWTSVGTAFGVGVAFGALLMLAAFPRRD